MMLPISDSGAFAIVAESAVSLRTRVSASPGAIPAATEDAEAIRRDLRYWRTRHATAIPTAAPADGSAGFGTIVTIRMSGTTRDIAIVGDDESDPGANRLAYGAPRARALLGAEPGDLLPFNGRADAIEVLAVAPIDTAEG